jgi:hypothetical protein
MRSLLGLGALAALAAGLAARADPLAGRYAVTADTVRDLRTNLVWQRNPWPAEVPLQLAGQTCQQLVAGGLPAGRWFAPTKKQLESLVTGINPGARGSTLDTSLASDGQPTFPTASARNAFCTGTQGPQASFQYWSVDFARGTSLILFASDQAPFVSCTLRCVRAAP